MSRSKLYVTEGLLYGGVSYERGDEIVGLNEATEKQLRDEDRISTTKPRDPAPADADPAAAPTTITDFSDDELLAEVEARGLIGDSGKVDYAELSIDELKALCAERELDVERGDGKKGDPLQADYVAALEVADSDS